MKCHVDGELEFLSLDGRGPVLLQQRSATRFDGCDWLREHRREIDELLLRHGGVVLRNFGLRSVSDFNRAVQVLCPTLLDYVNRSTPRRKLGGKLYTATEYPSDRTIPLHNESSYADAWGILSRVVDWPVAVAWRPPVVALDLGSFAKGRVSARWRDQAVVTAAAPAAR